LKIYMDVLRRYREGELSDFGLKYRDDWREAYMGIPSVEYKDDPANATII